MLIGHLSFIELLSSLSHIRKGSEAASIDATRSPSFSLLFFQLFFHSSVFLYLWLHVSIAFCILSGVNECERESHSLKPSSLRRGKSVLTSGLLDL